MTYKTISKLGACVAIAAALSAQIPDFKPSTPLLKAALTNDAPAMSNLLTAGANPNAGRFFGMPALTLAVINNNTSMTKALLSHGADPAAPDASGNTALMWSVGTDAPNPEIMELLLAKGADANTKNNAGESALTWAIRRGNMPAVARLKMAGASNEAAVRKAAESAIALLQKSGPQFVKVSGCASCHHQSLPQMLNGVARKRGLAIDEPAAAQQLKAVMAMFRPIREQLADGSITLPNLPISVSYALLGLAAEGHAPDETTAAMAAAIVRTQRADGSFPVLPFRAPLEASTFTGTAFSLRALQLFAPNASPQIAQARQWLAQAKPATNEDHAMRLLGLYWANAPKEQIDMAASTLVAAQRAGGGWAQLNNLEPDAYATGQALTALQLTGRAAANPTALENGIAYLLRTQLADGSWLVRTRSNPFQPLKESGFPHGRDQWISASATSWAGMALALSRPATPAAETEGN